MVDGKTICNLVFDLMYIVIIKHDDSVKYILYEHNLSDCLVGI